MASLKTSAVLCARRSRARCAIKHGCERMRNPLRRLADMPSSPRGVEDDALWSHTWLARREMRAVQHRQRTFPPAFDGRLNHQSADIIAPLQSIAASCQVIHRVERMRLPPPKVVSSWTTASPVRFFVSALHHRDQLTAQVASDIAQISFSHWLIGSMNTALVHDHHGNSYLYLYRCAGLARETAGRQSGRRAPAPAAFSLPQGQGDQDHMAIRWRND